MSLKEIIGFSLEFLSSSCMLKTSPPDTDPIFLYYINDDNRNETSNHFHAKMYFGGVVCGALQHNYSFITNYKINSIREIMDPFMYSERNNNLK